MEHAGRGGDPQVRRRVLRAAAEIVAGYDPACGEEGYENTVLKLAAIGFRMAAAGVPCAAGDEV